MRFEARLVPHRTVWLTWVPFLAALGGVLLAKIFERTSEVASEILAILSAVGFVAGVALLGLRWRRGLTLRLADDELVLGKFRARVSECRVEQGEFVFRSRWGTYASPMLTLRLPGGVVVTIGCEGDGGRAAGRSPTRPPRYLLDSSTWNALAHALATTRGLGMV